MTVTAQASTFSWGGQTAKEVTATTWYRHRVVDGDLSEVTDDRMGPPEVGGRPTPTIPFRAGYLVSGGLVLNPRLESTFGWILEGVMGAVSTTTDTPEAGMNRHKFAFAAANESWTPWMSFRKEIIGAALDGSDDLGVTYQDCRVIGLTMNFPNNGLITSRVDILGRDFVYEEDPTFVYANTMEGHESVPISCVIGGYMKIPGFSATELPIIGAQLTFGNVPLDLRQEMVYGSPKLDNVTTVLRTLGVTLTLKYQDPDLWQRIFTGGIGSPYGATWSQIPFIEDLDIVAQSPDDIPGLANPYQLRIQADEIMWRPVGGIRLAGNQAVLITLQGTAFENDAGDYCSFTLDNEVANYTWPT